MSVDDIAKRFGERMDRQVSASADRRAEAVEELNAAFRRAEEAQRRADDRTRELIATSLGIHDRKVIANAQVSLGNMAVLQRVDALLWQAFDLASVCEDSPLQAYPVVYCETLEEFYAAILVNQDISETIRQAVVEHEVAEARKRAEEGSGTLGVNLPGQGCYINGWLFGIKSGRPARAALQNPATFPRIFGTVCHEKLGHGFISAFTAMGQEKTRLGLWRYELAQRFSLRTADSPQSSLLLRKHSLIHQTSVLTEEGWATWVTKALVGLAAANGLLSPEARDASPAEGYTLGALGALLQTLQEESPAEAREHVEAFSAALQILLLEMDRDHDEMVFSAVRIVHALAPAFDAAFGKTFGQPTIYVVGYLLLRRLATQLGERNVPYAIMIAGNVTYELETTSVADLEGLLASDPRLNVDARLALLSRLTLQPGEDYRALASKARELLNLAVPEGW